MISFFRNPSFSFSIVLFTVLITASACNRSSDQREFERAAFSIPEGITQTDATGNVISRDSDDWRVAPFFQGVIEIDPAYPNPVLTNELVRINRIVTGVESVSGLRVFVFYESGNVRPIDNDVRNPLPPGLDVISLEPTLISEFPENPQGLYRVVITDLNENVITYGDIRIE
ncbi:hypothetical protein [Rhodohalobacter mucosus]|uniref:Uncharacterized protein n=1 Tax=Rhodohalobacter mucosus TaxID=2079485 RepID=A0A316U181_9BACT|nr:hypothetical protein [Rhodohalobacter mucosus]PWN06626.1 hypothetical protein DDZ15_08910 [Rhodohalobacter mucosus]